MLMPKRLTRGALHFTEKGLGLNFRSALSLSDSLVQNNIRDKQLHGCSRSRTRVHFTWQCPGTSIPFYIYPQLLMPQLSLTPM
jgi:hypothetical protein